MENTNNLKKYLDYKKELTLEKYAQTLLGNKVIELFQNLDFDKQDIKEITSSKHKNDIIGLVLMQVELKPNANENLNKLFEQQINQ